jgi:hypothetical protein
MILLILLPKLPTTTMKLPTPILDLVTAIVKLPTAALKLPDVKVRTGVVKLLTAEQKLPRAVVKLHIAAEVASLCGDADGGWIPSAPLEVRFELSRECPTRVPKCLLGLPLRVSLLVKC